jgi:hypothetical protein
MWNSLGVGIDTKDEDNMESRIRKHLLMGKGASPSAALYFLFSFLFFFSCSSSPYTLACSVRAVDIDEVMR